MAHDATQLLKDLTRSPAFKRIGANALERDRRETEAKRRAARDELDAIDEWYRARLETLSNERQAATEDLRVTEAAAAVARQRAQRVAAEEHLARLEKDRREREPRRVLRETIPQQWQHFDQELDNLADETRQAVRATRERRPLDLFRGRAGRTHSNAPAVARRLTAINAIREEANRLAVEFVGSKEQIEAKIDELRNAIPNEETLREYQEVDHDPWL